MSAKTYVNASRICDAGGRSRLVAAPDRQAGSTMVIVLVLAALGLAAGLYAASSARTESQIAYNDQTSQQALDVAEAGFNDAVMRISAHGILNDELASNGAGACAGNGVGSATSGLAAVGAAAALNGTCYRFRAFGPTGGYYVRAEDNNDETSGADNPLADKDFRIRLTSHGVAGTADRAVAGILLVMPNWGFYGINFVTLTGGSIVDSYLGAYSVATATATSKVGTNGNLSLSGNPTQINGDAFAGGTISASGGAAITGAVTPGAPAVSLPAVAACSPFGPAAGVSPAGSYNAGTGTLSMSGGGTVTLAPGTYCFSSVTLSGGSILAISAATTINTTGTFDGSGGSVSNTTNNSANLKLNSSGGVVKLSGGSGSYMQVYAPTAAVTFSGGSDFYGSVTGLNITNSGGTHMHQDLAAGGTATVSSWHEVR